MDINSLYDNCLEEMDSLQDLASFLEGKGAVSKRGDGATIREKRMYTPRTPIEAPAKKAAAKSPKKAVAKKRPPMSEEARKAIGERTKKAWLRRRKALKKKAAKGANAVTETT